MKLHYLAMVPLLLALACGSNPPSTDQHATDQISLADLVDDVNSPTPSLDVSTQDANDLSQMPPAPDLSVAEVSTADSACTQTLTFEFSKRTLLEAVDHHGTFVNGGRLYVIGGNNYVTTFATVWSAQIKPDGDLEPFEVVGELPGPTAGFGLAKSATRIYVVSGQANGFLKSVYSAALNGDGSLGTWRTEASIPEGRFHITAAIVGDYLYAIGGLNAKGETTNTIYAAKIGLDGILGSFFTAATLADSRSHHASYTYAGRLYLHGGFSGEPFKGLVSDLLNVISATPGADGTLGAFSVVQTLPAPIATHALFATNGCLFRLGGLSTVGGVVYHDDVLRAGLDQLGVPDAFQTVATLPKGRSHVHHVGRWKQVVYLVGGSVGPQKVSTDVLIGRFK